MLYDLTSIDLSYCKLPVNILINLGKNIRFIKSAEKLSLRGCDLGDLSSEALADIIKNGISIQHLDISANYIGIKGLRIICRALNNNNSIRTIDMSDNPFGKHSESGQLIRHSLERNTALQSLRITLTSKYIIIFNREVRKKVEGRVLPVAAPSSANSFLSLFEVYLYK